LPPAGRFHYASIETSSREERSFTMATDPGARMADATMDAASLYREDIYTDR
jgi:hypothetical protein